MKPIHLHKQLIKSILSLVIAATDTSASAAPALTSTPESKILNRGFFFGDDVNETAFSGDDNRNDGIGNPRTELTEQRQTVQLDRHLSGISRASNSQSEDSASKEQPSSFQLAAQALKQKILESQQRSEGAKRSAERARMEAKSDQFESMVEFWRRKGLMGLRKPEIKKPDRTFTVKRNVPTKTPPSATAFQGSRGNRRQQPPISINSNNGEGNKDIESEKRAVIPQDTTTEDRMLQQNVNDPNNETKTDGFDTSEWDLSPMKTAVPRDESSRGNSTRGAARAEEFSKVATGNFGDILRRWREENFTGDSAKGGDSDKLSADNFDSLLKHWRHYRFQNGMSDGSSVDGFDEFGHLLEHWKEQSLMSPESVPLLKQGQPWQGKPSVGGLFTPSPVKNFRADAQKGTEEGQVSEMARASAQPHDPSCPCASAMFSGHHEMVEFFLPKLGIPCTCGRDIPASNFQEDPTAIQHILRPWQCEFLRSFGVLRGDQLVKANHRSANVLAKAMRKWRSKNGFLPVSTVSCGMALHIWSRTSKSFVRNVRKQIAKKVPEIVAPDTLLILSTLLRKEDKRLSVPSRRKSRRQGSVETDRQIEI